MADRQIVVEDGRTIVVEGAGLLAPLVAAATQAAAVASSKAGIATAQAEVSTTEAGIATTKAAEAALSASFAGAYKQAVQDAVGGIPSGGSITPQVATRTIMAALTPAFAGQVVSLTEAGREGLFRWTVGDQSAKVTLDPLQGLYVPPATATSGVSGAWARVVSDNRYRVEWWGATTVRTDNEVVLNAIAVPGLLPPLAVLNGVGDFGVSAKTTFTQPITIDGEYNFGLIDKTGTGNYDLLLVCGSFSTVTRCRFKGPLFGAFANEPHVVVLGWGGIQPTGPDAVARRTVTGITISDNDIEGESGIQEALYLYADLTGFPTTLTTYQGVAYTPPLSRREDNPFIPIFYSRVFNNRIFAHKHAICVYGSTGSRFWDNRITLAERLAFDASAFISGFRFLGAKDAICTNNYIEHPTETDRQVQNYGFFLGNAQFYYQSVLRLSNVNITLVNNTTVNCSIHHQIESAPLGSCTIIGARIYGGMASTLITQMFNIGSGGIAGLDFVDIRDVIARGCAYILGHDGGVRRLSIKNVDWISNANVQDVTHIKIENQTDTSYAQFGIGTIEIENVRAVRGVGTITVGYDIITNSTTARVSVLNNTFSQDAIPGGSAAAISIVNLSAASTALYTTDGITWSPLDGSGSNIKPAGNNKYLPPGARAAAV